VVAGEYPLGIAGLIAGRLVEETGCPAVVLERGADYCKGSARGPQGFHLAEALAACSDLLVKYGGHAQAAGLTLRTPDLGAFEERFRTLAAAALGPTGCAPRLAIDGQVSLREFNWDALQALRALEPCGMGNPRPLFLTPRVEVRDARPLGETGVAFRLREGGQTMRASAFRLPDRPPPNGSIVNVVYEVECRASGEQEWAELGVRGIRPADG
jgi:single-stranded-DNA-specific exonuclease